MRALDQSIGAGLTLAPVFSFQIALTGTSKQLRLLIYHLKLILFFYLFQAAKEKGKKFNYEVEEIENVYDIVDEAEYAEEVSHSLFLISEVFSTFRMW